MDDPALPPSGLGWGTADVKEEVTHSLSLAHSSCPAKRASLCKLKCSGERGPVTIVKRARVPLLACRLRVCKGMLVLRRILIAPVAPTCFQRASVPSARASHYK